MQSFRAGVALASLNAFMANDEPIPQLSEGLYAINTLTAAQGRRIAPPDAEMLIKAIADASEEIDRHFPADEDRANILHGLEAAARLVRAHSEDGAQMQWGPRESFPNSFDNLLWMEDRAKLRIAQNIAHNESLRGEIREHREKRRSLFRQWREDATQ